MPRPVADALAEWQLQAPEGVPFVLLGRERFETVKRNWQRCREGLAREGGKRPRPWQTRDVVNNVLRSIKRHTKRAGIDLTAPIIVHTFRKSYGQNHADHGTPIHVVQQLMGHASIATTREFYIQVSQGSEREAAARYEQLLAEPVKREAPCLGAEKGKTDAQVTPDGVRR